MATVALAALLPLLAPLLLPLLVPLPLLLPPLLPMPLSLPLLLPKAVAMTMPTTIMVLKSFLKSEVSLRLSSCSCFAAPLSVAVPASVAALKRLTALLPFKSASMAVPATTCAGWRGLAVCTPMAMVASNLRLARGVELLSLYGQQPAAPRGEQPVVQQPQLPSTRLVMCAVSHWWKPQLH